MRLTAESGFYPMRGLTTSMGHFFSLPLEIGNVTINTKLNERGGAEVRTRGWNENGPMWALTSCPHRGPRPAELLLLWFILHPSSLPSPHHRTRVCVVHIWGVLPPPLPHCLHQFISYVSSSLLPPLSRQCCIGLDTCPVQWRCHAITLFKLPMDSAVADSIYGLLHPSTSAHFSSSHLEKNQFFLAHGQTAAAVKLHSKVEQEELI